MPGQRGGRRGVRSGRSSRRRPKEWQTAEPAAGLEVITPGECAVFPLITSFELDAEYTDLTLMRIRGMYHVSLPDNLAISGTFHSFGAIGIIEVEGIDDITATPVTWCPLTDGDASWIWHNYYSIRSSRITVAGVSDTIDYESQREEIDTAAMRRMDAGDSSLYLAIESDIFSETNIGFWFGTRFILSEK